MRSRGLSTVYTRPLNHVISGTRSEKLLEDSLQLTFEDLAVAQADAGLLYTSDAEEEEDRVDIGGRRRSNQKK